MIACEDAWARLREAAEPLGSERVSIEEAAGRILAEPVMAGFDAPSAPVSAMDGYAVREVDLAAAGAALPVAGASFAGQPFAGEVPPGQCVRIFTGAMVPPGLDRVVIQEEVEAGDGTAFFRDVPRGGRNIRAAGSDFRRGETLLVSGAPLTPPALIAAAGADLGTLSVWRPPSVVVLATGDELAAPGTARERPGAVPDSVSIAVASMAEDWGARVLRRERLPDDPDTLTKAGARALADADVTVVTGGASVGERDYARTMFGDGLESVFAKVAMKPGKPVWVARKGGRWIVGLPGNPGSALVTARLFLMPLLAALGGRRFDSALGWRTETAADPLAANGSRETFMRARRGAEGVHIATNQESGAQAVLGQSDLLLRRASDAPATPAGSTVDVLSLA